MTKNCTDCTHYKEKACSINKKNGYKNCKDYRAISIQELEKERSTLSRSGTNPERFKILTEKLNELNGWC